MIKKMYKTKLLITTLAFMSLLLLIPKNKIKNIKQELSYTSENIKVTPIYLLDSNNYVAKTEIGLKSTKNEDIVKELANILIKEGPGESLIPSGFKSIINEETKIISLEIKDAVLKINFSKSFLEENDKKALESLVYTMTELEDIDKVIVFIEGEILTKLTDGTLIKNPIDRTIGINKIYDINNLDNVTSVTIYYLNEYNDNLYYVPVTKYLNDTREKITIIIDELNSTSLYTTNLMSFLNQDVKLLSAVEKDETLNLQFNEAIFNSDDLILEEVIYTILYSVEDNYNVKNVTFNVENKEILKKVLKY
ncbi:MAG: GerMN domain-containing protein [Bacilli bacterium]